MKDSTDATVRSLDARLPSLRGAQFAAHQPAQGWLRAVRDAVGLSQGRAARKLEIKRQSYAGLEVAEDGGSISLRSLARAAATMDCDLVYFLVPRETVARTFAELAAIQNPGSKPRPTRKPPGEPEADSVRRAEGVSL